MLLLSIVFSIKMKLLLSFHLQQQLILSVDNNWELPERNGNKKLPLPSSIIYNRPSNSLDNIHKLETIELKDRNIPTSIYTMAICTATIIVAGFAFSIDTKRKIWENAGGNCEDSGKGGCKGELECAHINHNENLPSYDDYSNGRLLCTWHHKQDHLNRKPKHLGMTSFANKLAIRGLDGKLKN